MALGPVEELELGVGRKVVKVLRERHWAFMMAEKRWDVWKASIWEAEGRSVLEMRAPEWR